MYELRSKLIYNGKLVGLRLRNMITYKDVDFNINHLGNSASIENEINKRVNHSLYLTDIGGVLVTENEHKKNIVIGEVPNEDIPFVQKMLLGRHTAELCEKIAKKLYKEAMAYEKVGARGRKVHMNGKNEWGDQERVYYYIIVSVDSQYKFNWNTDDDYNEYHYDTHGIITDDEVFSAWEKYVSELGFRYMKETGLMIKAEVTASKYEITMRVLVDSYSFNTKVQKFT